MRRFIFLLALAAAACALAGCSSLRADPSVRNPSLEILALEGGRIPKSCGYTWGPHYYRIEGGAKIDVAEVDRRIRSSIASELRRRGYRETETGGELIVSFAAGLNAELNETEFNKSYGEEFKAAFPPAARPNETRCFKKGSLVIDVLDAKTRKLCWRGTVLANIDTNVDEKAKDRRVRAAVRALLDQFPKPRTAS